MLKILKNIWIVVLICIFVLPCVVHFVVQCQKEISNPLRKDEEYIKNWILTSIPYGTQMDSAVEIANKKGWDVEWIEERGYSSSEVYGEVKEYVKGDKSMYVHLGQYTNLFMTSVSAFFAFDNDSKLIDINVVKDMDSL